MVPFAVPDTAVAPCSTLLPARRVSWTCLHLHPRHPRCHLCRTASHWPCHWAPSSTSQKGEVLATKFSAVYMPTSSQLEVQVTEKSSFGHLISRPWAWRHVGTPLAALEKSGCLSDSLARPRSEAAPCNTDTPRAGRGSKQQRGQKPGARTLKPQS